MGKWETQSRKVTTIAQFSLNKIMGYLNVKGIKNGGFISLNISIIINIICIKSLLNINNE
jgi:hypothetical protein